MGLWFVLNGSESIKLVCDYACLIHNGHLNPLSDVLDADGHSSHQIDSGRLSSVSIYL